MFVYPPTGSIFSLQHFNVSLFEAQLTTINLGSPSEKIFILVCSKLHKSKSSLNWFDAIIFRYQF